MDQIHCKYQYNNLFDEQMLHIKQHYGVFESVLTRGRIEILYATLKSF